MTRNFAIYSLALLFLFSFLGCKNPSTKSKELVSTSSPSISAIDSSGKTITLAHEARRVVVLFPSLVDEVYMLHAEDKLVGIPQLLYETPDAFSFLAQFDKRLAQHKIATPTYNGHSINIETLIGLNPDLVLTFNLDTEENQQMENLGIPVFTFSSGAEENILEELDNVGVLLGKKERARQITNYVSREVKRLRTHKTASPKSIYYAWSRGRIMSTSGPGSLIDNVIRLSGSQNACPIPIEAPNISAETMYKWNPDIIVLWNSELKEVYKLEEIASLPAVKEKHIYVMTPPFLYDPHTVKFILFAEQLKYWCDPAYSEADLKAKIDKAFSVLYGKTYAL